MSQNGDSDEDSINSASIVVAFISLLVGTGLMLQSQAEIAETGAVKAFNAGGNLRDRAKLGLQAARRGLLPSPTSASCRRTCAHLLVPHLAQA